MIEFNNLKEQIKKCNDCTKSLECFPQTLETYKKESEKNNPYRKLAENFEKYNNQGIDDSADYLFYEYVKNNTQCGTYKLPISELESIEIKIDFLHPFTVIDGFKYIDPRWHLLVSYCMYLDAAYNHIDDERCNKLAKLNGWKDDRKKSGTIRNETYKTFINELENI